MCVWASGLCATYHTQVLLTHEEADTHDNTDLDTLKREEPEFYAHVERVLTKARNEHYY